ncbi:hypothetical protein ACFQ9X_03335 [Catenulispora yoronensis]
MRRCQHFCGCEGNPVGRDPDTGLLLCAGCLGRSILGTDCSLARRYFVHVPARFGEGPWAEPPPLRDGDRTAVPAEFEGFLTVRVGGGAVEWDFCRWRGWRVRLWRTRRSPLSPRRRPGPGAMPVVPVAPVVPAVPVPGCQGFPAFRALPAYPG